MSNTLYKLNLTGKSPEDKRDFDYDERKGMVVSTFPKKLMLIDEDIVEKNQGSYGSCAAQVAAFIHSFHHFREKAKWEDFSVAFTYALRWDYIYDRKDGNLPEGMVPRDLMSIMLHRGCVFESELPYVRENLVDFDIFEDKAKLDELYKSSIRFRIKEYARVSLSEDSVKSALLENGPLLIAVPVYNYGSEMWIQGEGEEFRGGHAMAVIGYDEEGIFIRNSWGQKWNGDGTCKMKWEDLSEAWEIWTTVDELFDPSNPRPLPHRPPSEEEEKKEDEKWNKVSDIVLKVILGLAVAVPLVWTLFSYFSK